MYATEEERPILRHISIGDIDGFCEEIEQGKAKDESLSLIAEWEMHWRLFPLRKDLNEKILTPRTLFSLSMLNTHACYRLLINSRISLQNTSQAPCQSSDSSRSSSSDSSSSFEGRRTARQKAILPARSPTSKSDSTSLHEYPSPTTYVPV